MLKAHEIFAQMPQGVPAQLFGYLFEKEKPLYKAAVDSLAKQRKLRPVFIERKPRSEQYAWLQQTLARKASEPIAAHLLQIWLVGAHSKLLCAFLDGLGIAHDANGTMEILPPAPPKDALRKVIEDLRVTFDPAVVTVYLHAFQALDESGWPTLGELLVEDERLRLSPPKSNAETTAGPG